MKVSIGIATFKREAGLRLLLQSISEMLVDFELIIIVGDNEGYSEVTKAVVAEFYNTCPFKLYLIPVPTPGISNVRNELIKFSFINQKSDFLAMIDDDEIADKSWIKHLVSSIVQSKSNVVGGNVLPRFDKSPPIWINGIDIYHRPIRESGPISRIFGAGNFIMDKSCIYLNINFDPDFSFTGGEDNDFFLRLKNNGCTFFYNADAITYEHYPRERISKRWAIKRTYRIGKIDARIKLKYDTKIKCMMFSLKSLAAFFLMSFMCILSVFNSNKFMFYFLKLIRQAGKIKGLFSHPSKAYGN